MAGGELEQVAIRILHEHIALTPRARCWPVSLNTALSQRGDGGIEIRHFRRDAIAVGVLALIGTTLTRRAEAQKTDGDPKSEQGSAIKTRTASCNCGQLRVTSTGPDPKRNTLCNCYLCQKQSGSVFVVQARFPKEQVTIEGKSTAWKFPIEGDKPVTYRTCASAGATFHFCPVCGSTVWYTADADDSFIGVKIGAFADPTFPPPKISGFEAYRHPWAMDVGALKMEHLD